MMFDHVYYHTWCGARMFFAKSKEWIHITIIKNKRGDGGRRNWHEKNETSSEQWTWGRHVMPTYGRLTIRRAGWSSWGGETCQSQRRSSSCGYLKIQTHAPFLLHFSVGSWLTAWNTEQKWKGQEEAVTGSYSNSHRNHPPLEYMTRRGGGGPLILAPFVFWANVPFLSNDHRMEERKTMMIVRVTEKKDRVTDPQHNTQERSRIMLQHQTWQDSFFDSWRFRSWKSPEVSLFSIWQQQKSKMQIDKRRIEKGNG